MNRNVDFEVNILWLDDQKKFPYLRECSVTCSQKQGWRKSWACNRRYIAIAELSPEAKTIQRIIRRRGWYFDKNDQYPAGDCPCEAVIPESISAGQESVYGRRDAPVVSG